MLNAVTAQEIFYGVHTYIAESVIGKIYDVVSIIFCEFAETCDTIYSKFEAEYDQIFGGLVKVVEFILEVLGSVHFLLDFWLKKMKNI